MNFAESTQRLRAAILAGDLEAAGRALHARNEALARGEQPSVGDAEAGERVLLNLTALKRRLADESARLSQLKSAIAVMGARPHIDCRG